MQVFCGHIPFVHAPPPGQPQVPPQPSLPPQVPSAGQCGAQQVPWNATVPPGHGQVPPQLFGLPDREPSGGHTGAQQLPSYRTWFVGQPQVPPQPSARPPRLPFAGQFGAQHVPSLRTVPPGHGQVPPQLFDLPDSEPSGGQMGVQQLSAVIGRCCSGSRRCRRTRRRGRRGSRSGGSSARSSSRSRAGVPLGQAHVPPHPSGLPLLEPSGGHSGVQQLPPCSDGAAGAAARSVAAVVLAAAAAVAGAVRRADAGPLDAAAVGAAALGAAIARVHAGSVRARAAGRACHAGATVGHALASAAHLAVGTRNGGARIGGTQVSAQALPAPHVAAQAVNGAHLPVWASHDCPVGAGHAVAGHLKAAGDAAPCDAGLVVRARHAGAGIRDRDAGGRHRSRRSCRHAAVGPTGVGLTRACEADVTGGAARRTPPAGGDGVHAVPGRRRPPCHRCRCSGAWRSPRHCRSREPPANRRPGFERLADGDQPQPAAAIATQRSENAAARVVRVMRLPNDNGRPLDARNKEKGISKVVDTRAPRRC